MPVPYRGASRSWPAISGTSLVYSRAASRRTRHHGVRTCKRPCANIRRRLDVLRPPPENVFAISVLTSSIPCGRGQGEPRMRTSGVKRLVTEVLASLPLPHTADVIEDV